MTRISQTKRAGNSVAWTRRRDSGRNSAKHISDGHAALRMAGLAGLSLLGVATSTWAATVKGTISAGGGLSTSANYALVASLGNLSIPNIAVPAITISAALPSGTTGGMYAQTLTSADGQANYTWSVSSGALPAGLTMSSAGVLSGKPTATGTANFRIRVTGADGFYAEQDFSLTVLALTQVTITANPENGGSVMGGGTYSAGTNIQLTAVASIGWLFTGWNDGNTQSVRIITIPATNITLTANFTNAAHIYMQDQAGNVTKWTVNTQGILQQYATFGGMGAWNLKAIGDVNGDGQADLFWQISSGWVVAYLSQTNSSYLGVGLGNLGSWVLRAVADVDGDGIADLIWQHSSGWVSVWLMNSNCTQRTGYSLGNLGVWKLKGAGDINKDGKADLIWQSPMGDVVVWLSQPGGGFQGLGIGNLGAWELRTIHDVDGDGIADLLWQNPGGWVVVWYMNTNGTVRAGVGLGNIFIGTTTNKIMAVE